MTVFLDYYKRDGITTDLSILTAKDSFFDFIEGNMQNATEHLIEPGFIVVFGKTQAPLQRVFAENPVLQEYGFFKGRWLDLRLFLRKRTGREAAITKLAIGTLGMSGEGLVQKLEHISYEKDSDSLNIFEKMHDRLSVIKSCYETAKQTGYLSFYYRKELEEVEFDIEEPGHPMSFD